MKILLLDVDSCYFCPCSSAEVGWLGNITRSVCQVKGEENTVYMDGVSGVPKWCPLRPLPQIIAYEVTDTQTAKAVELIDNAFKLGWNTCLNVITGELNAITGETE